MMPARQAGTTGRPQSTLIIMVHLDAMVIALYTGYAGGHQQVGR